MIRLKKHRHVCMSKCDDIRSDQFRFLVNTKIEVFSWHTYALEKGISCSIQCWGFKSWFTNQQHLHHLPLCHKIHLCLCHIRASIFIYLVHVCGCICVGACVWVHVCVCFNAVDGESGLTRNISANHRVPWEPLGFHNDSNSWEHWRSSLRSCHDTSCNPKTSTPS